MTILDTIFSYAPDVEDTNRILADPMTTWSDQGGNRNVALLPELGWVIKYELYGDDGHSSNEEEIQNYEFLKDNLPVGLAVPYMFQLDNGVLVAEFIPGFHPDHHKSKWNITPCNCVGLYQDMCWNDLCKHNLPGLGDIHYNNVIIYKNLVYVIDLEV